ncbi:MAG TPA: hypothetical protein VFE16_05015 [Candidatus Cybelea sp.]|jgi:hypothetical protein|nr:hypothetical protein [Candidatus Cybelea sp.]
MMMRNVRRAAWIAASLAALAGCSHAARGTKPSMASPSPARARALPSPVPTPSPAATPSAASTAPVVTPSAAPASGVAKKAAALLPPPKKIPRLPPDAPPQILEVQISETEVRPGDSVQGNVVTSSNVASVEARIGGYAVSLRKVAVGRFALTYKVVGLPWFVHGNFTMQVIARNTRGTAVARDVPLTVR